MTDYNKVAWLELSLDSAAAEIAAMPEYKQRAATREFGFIPQAPSDVRVEPGQQWVSPGVTFTNIGNQTLYVGVTPESRMGLSQPAPTPPAATQDEREHCEQVIAKDFRSPAQSHERHVLSLLRERAAVRAVCEAEFKDAHMSTLKAFAREFVDPQLKRELDAYKRDACSDGNDIATLKAEIERLRARVQEFDNLCERCQEGCKHGR